MSKLLFVLLTFGAATHCAVHAQTVELGPDVPPFVVRLGYRVDLVAKDIGEVRFLQFGEPGTLYVSEPRAGKIITLRETGGVWTKVADSTADKPMAHGMHYADKWLWFPQSGAVWKARDRRQGSGKFASENLERWFRDAPLESEVNLEVYARAS